MPSFASTLELAIHAALNEAEQRRQHIATIEHLLLALLDEPNAARTLKACAVDLDKLRDELVGYLSILATEPADGEIEPKPDKAFQRVIQRAAIHVQSSGRTEVTGANVLVAIFAERESTAAQILLEQDMTRYDAVNFVAHGVAKDPAYNEDRTTSAVEEVDDFEEIEIVEATEELLTEAEWRARFASEAQSTEREPTVGKRPVQSTDQPFVFLSYSNEDREFARALMSKLEQYDIPFWWDQNISPGDEWRAKIAEQLEKATIVLTLWTKNSVSSKAVIEEAARAQRQRKLVHVVLDDSECPYGFSETQYVDLRDWDTSDTHPAFLSLIYAIQDKLTVPTVSAATNRIRESSPIEVVVHNGLLALKDAPANVPSAVANPSDLQARLAGLRQSVDNMCKMCSETDVYQLPPTLHHCLDAVRTASVTLPVTWYALDDAKTMLKDCMVDNFASESWNTVVYNGLAKLLVRIDEIQPLLQPLQIDPFTHAPRPPVPEPIITENETAEVVSLAEQANSELSSITGKSVIDANTAEAMESAVKQLRELSESNDKHKLFKFRRGLKKAAYIVGGLLSAIGSGVAVNLLTAPTAAQTLFTKLTPIFERILNFFF